MNIRPFRAARPVPELAEKIASPPYDVVNTAEAEAYARGNPLSFLHVVRAEIDLPAGTDLYSPEVYRKAGENLRALIRDGRMMQDAAPCFYLYRLAMDGRKQTGLVALVDCQAYAEGKVKIHEKTLKAKEDDRVNYILGTRAHNEPVFFTYPDAAGLGAKLEALTAAPPVYTFTTKDQFGTVDHEFWVVGDEPSKAIITGGFAPVPAFYVADGHHRSASAWRVWEQMKKENAAHTGHEEYNFFMAVIFPHDQLFIYDYNRLVKDLNGLAPEAFLKKAGEKFTLKPGHASKRPGAVRQFGMYLDRQWFLLEPKPGTFPAGDLLRSLDVSILQENLLGPVLGIDDPKTNPRIAFAGGILGMEELERRVDSGKFAAAFACFPTRIEDVLKVADAGRTMPPKSTWFEPKLRSGLFVHLLD
jgi:uncharacterized protein (DUF1015 family)